MVCLNNTDSVNVEQATVLRMPVVRSIDTWKWLAYTENGGEMHVTLIESKSPGDDQGWGRTTLV